MRHPASLPPSRLIGALLVLLLPIFANGATLPELFRKGKEEFSRGHYRESLQTFRELDRQSRQPGLEQERFQLEGPLAFYLGASLAALGERSAAKKQFSIYLRGVPGARVDPSLYPKAVIDVLEETRRDIARERKAQRLDLAAVYARFESPAEVPLDRWADTGIGLLLTESERSRWRTTTTASGRAGIVSAFWSELGASGANGLRSELQRRTAFADSMFSSGTTPGRLSDKGLVFTLLGPPSEILAGTTEGEASTVAEEIGNVRILSGHAPLDQKETWVYEQNKRPGSPGRRFTFLVRDGDETTLTSRDEVLEILRQVAAQIRASGEIF